MTTWTIRPMSLCAATQSATQSPIMIAVALVAIVLATARRSSH